MPIYEYRCKNGHTFEVMQSMSDDPVSACEVCGSSVERVFHPVAVHFKGSGFYTTDYGKGRSAPATSSSDSASSADSGGGESKGTAATKSESSSSSSGSD